MIIILLILTDRNVSDLEIQGPKGEIITLETVNELVERISTQDPSSLQNSTTKSKRKKKKDGSSAQDANVTQSESSSTTNLKSSTKKKKKKTFHDSLMNGHHNGDREEVDGGNEDRKNTSKVRNELLHCKRTALLACVLYSKRKRLSKR